MTPWNTDTDAYLIELYASKECPSFSIISAKINEKFGTTVTRNSVIGRTHRLKLVARHTRSGVTVPKERSPYTPRTRSGEHHSVIRIVRANGNSDRMRVIETRESREQIKLRCVEVIPRNISLLESSDNDCRFIAGDDLLYCGHPRREGSSYCGPHDALIYIPATPSKPAARKYFGTDFSRGVA